MEPMALGSPSHSPSGGSPGANFLPPYLMGEFHQPITPRAGSLSPTKARTLTFGNSPPVRPSPQPHHPYNNTPLLQKTANNVSFSNKASSGPPTQGLFDTMHQPEWGNNNVGSSHKQPPPTPFTSPLRGEPNRFYPAHESYMNDSQMMLNSHNQSMLRNQLQALENNPTQHDVFDGANIEDENEFWITVFGFPPSAASMILTQFSNCGNIIEKKYPSQGNWVWLRFSSRSDIGRALALNGRILAGGVMIGVMQCSQPHSVNHHINKSGARQLAVGSPRLPLNASTVSPTSPSNTSVQRSSGAISRALEYVFGW